MHAIELGGPDLGSLRRITMDDPPAPGPGRVLVRMRAASLNYIDVAVAHGQYEDAKYPLVPLVDGAGEVVATGPEVWQVEVGDRVAVHGKSRWIAGAGSTEVSGVTRGVGLQGSLVEIAALDAGAVVRMPGHLSWEEIASVPGAATGAWGGLEAASIGAASTVVLRGTGGVSTFGLQLAKARGARVLLTSSSGHKLERARALGADETIDVSERPDWEVVVRSLTDGRGADLVIDSVGGPDFGRSIRAVRYGGTVFALGFAGGTTTELDLIALNSNGVRVQGTNGASVADLRAVAAVIGAHRIQPVVDRSFPLAELTDAYRFVQSGGHFGKVAVRLDW